MKYPLGLAVAVTLMLVAQIDRPAAQPNNLQLSEQDKSVVIQAAIEAKTHQETPKDFTPALGAVVPRSVHQHSFKPDIAREVPAPKHFFYAYLDREIILINSATKVAAVIPLPAKYVSNGQTDQGALEPESESNKGGASTTGSVPAYTSPETNK